MSEQQLALRQAESANQTSAFGNKLRYFGSLLAVTGVSALAAAGCGGSSGGENADTTPVGSGSEAASRGGWDGTPVEKPPAKKPSETNTSDADSSGDDYEIPDTSSVVVSDTTAAEIGGLGVDVASLPVLGTDIDLEGIEEDCQEIANYYFSNQLKVENGSTDTEANIHQGITGALEFINEEGYYSNYSCLSNDAQDMYGEALTSQFQPPK